MPNLPKSPRSRLEPQPETNATAPALGFLTDINERAVTYWSRSLAALTQEMTQFVGARLQEDVNAWFGLASCRNLNDVLECQRRFAEKATSDYLDEYRKLSEIALNLASESTTPPRNGE